MMKQNSFKEKSVRNSLLFVSFFAMLLVDSGCGTPKYELTLMKLMEQPDIDAALLIIENGRPCDDPLPNNMSPINYLAFRSDYYSLTKMLESGKCRVNVGRKNEANILSSLIDESDREEIIGELKAYGFDVNWQLKMKPSIIRWALVGNDANDVEFLVKHGAKKENFYQTNGTLKEFIRQNQNSEALRFLENHSWTKSPPKKVRVQRP